MYAFVLSILNYIFQFFWLRWDAKQIKQIQTKSNSFYWFGQSLRDFWKHLQTIFQLFNINTIFHEAGISWLKVKGFWKAFLNKKRL